MQRNRDPLGACDVVKEDALSIGLATDYSPATLGTNRA